MVEQRTENPCVPGSIPGGATSLPPKPRVLIQFIRRGASFYFFPPNIRQLNRDTDQDLCIAPQMQRSPRKAEFPRILRPPCEGLKPEGRAPFRPDQKEILGLYLVASYVVPRKPSGTVSGAKRHPSHSPAKYCSNYWLYCGIFVLGKRNAPQLARRFDCSEETREPIFH